MKLSLPSNAKPKHVRPQVALHSARPVRRALWWHIQGQVYASKKSKRRSRRYLSTTGRWITASDMHEAACFVTKRHAVLFMKRMLHPSSIQVAGLPIFDGSEASQRSARYHASLEHEKELANGYADSI